MARGVSGLYRNPSAAEAAQLLRQERRGFRAGLYDVKIDLKPLAKGLLEMSPKRRDTIIVRGINKGMAKFNTWAYRKLKDWTGILRPSRLRKGVRIQQARGSTWSSTYTIRDRNIRVTKDYFRMSYIARLGNKPGSPGGLARWGKPYSPLGGSYTAWSGARIAKGTFAMPGLKPLFIHLRKAGHNTGKSGGSAIMPVFGPNPAQEMTVHGREVDAALSRITVEVVQPEIKRQLELLQQEAKARNKL